MQPSAPSACTPFSDDFEPAALPGWVVQTDVDLNPAPMDWAVSTEATAHSPTNAYKTDMTGVDEKDDRLIAPPQDIDSTSHLIFWHRFSTENGFDGGVLEVSTDGGVNWVDVLAGGGVFVTGGYNSSIDPGFGSRIAGRAAWTGMSPSFPNAMNMVDVSVGAFAGSARKFRWRAVTDPLAPGSTYGDYWAIDDVQFICGGGTPTPTPTPDPCNVPYVQMAGPGNPGNLPSDPTQGELTIQRINVGEPFTTCADNSVTFVMKVNNLDPTGSGTATLPANAEWKFNFTVTGTDNAEHNIFVAMDTFASNMATPTTPDFSYGRRDPSTTGFTEAMQCRSLITCPAMTGTFAADGTITIKLKLATAITFAAPAAPAMGVAFTWNGSTAGVQLKSVTGSTILLAGVFLETVQTTGTTGPTYTRRGNVFCGALPLAVLSASPSPASGGVPLSVTFDGSGSTDPNPCPGVDLNSYTMDFGEGNPPVTQAAPSFVHTYNALGTYIAKLKVGNTAGQVSTNPAQITVTATSALPPVLSSVVSRKTHGLLDFDIDMPLTGGPGIECRSGDVNGDYRLVFTFASALSSVTGATVTRHRLS